MIEVKFIIGGREVSSNGLQDALESEALKIVKENLLRKLGSISCPDHHRSPRVIVSGSSLHELSFSVEGCCQKLVDEVKKRI